MRFIRERKFLLAMAVVLIFSGVMAVRQFIENQTNHAEWREAFIFLHGKGHNAEAEKLYARLLWNLQHEPTRHLIEDLQRTSLIAPTNQSPSTNILVRYHITIKRELEKRFEQEYLKARKLSETSPAK
jgi:hypothetical protein